jgi:hypothetical protein
MATVAHVDHFALSDRIEERLRRGALTSRQVEDFKDFLAEVDRDLLHHRITTPTPGGSASGRQPMLSCATSSSSSRSSRTSSSSRRC